MADNFFGSITLPISMVDEEIAQQIKLDFGISMDGEKNLSYDTDFEVDGELITFNDQLAYYGQFDELENLLKSKNVPFDRHSSSYFELAAENFYFRPHEQVEEIYVSLGHIGEPIIPTSFLKEILSLDSEEVAEALKKLIQKYDPNVTPLRDDAKINHVQSNH